MAAETYPIVSCPEKGTVLYPYRRIQRPRTGRLEMFFVQHLKNVMPENVQILQDVCINVSESLPPYYPDIAIMVEGRPDIRIDVEIDEPYTIDRKPIHYISCGDQYRDNLLNRHGWTVVRFAVQQIQGNVQACAEFVGEEVRRHGGVSRSEEWEVRSEITPAGGNVPLISRWTHGEALIMAAQGKCYPEEVAAPSERMSFSEEEKRVYLHFVVGEDLAPTLGEHDLLLHGGGGAVAQEVHGLLEIGDHRLDLVLIFCDFVFREFLGLCAKGETQQQ